LIYKGKRILEVLLMKQILKIIAMILVVAAVVSAAGCAGKTNTAENKTQGASEQITHTSAETPTAPIETPATVITPTTASVTTPSEVNASAIPAIGGQYVQNGTHISTTQRNLQIEQSHTETTSTVSNGTLTVSQSATSYGTTTNPFSTAKKNTNPFNNTGNNNAVSTNSGILKIIPANGSTTNATGNQTVIHISTTTRNKQIEQAAQNVTGN
jgi:hypothetical protein